MKRALAAAAALLVARAAAAGEQLSVDDLVQRSAAIAVVDVTYPRGKQPGRIAVAEWLAGGPRDGTDPSAWFGPCVPTRHLLKRWLDAHPRHPGRATWQRLLKDGRGRQLVFLVDRPGDGLRPACETEVMLGWGFAVHAGFEEARARVLELGAAPGDGGR